MRRVSRFHNVQVSPDGQDVVYRGVADDNSILEVWQPVSDMDVMLVLIAGLLESQMKLDSSETAPRAHEVASIEVEAGELGSVTLIFRSPPGVTRSFALTSDLAANMSSMLGRARMRAVP